MTSDRLAHQLSAVVGPAHVLSDPALRAAYETDFTGRYAGRSRLVVRPADTAEVAEVVRICLDGGVPVVPQGGNTGLVGGSVPGPAGTEVVLSLRRLDGIGPVDTAVRQVTVGAGTVLGDLQRQVAAQGLEFGVDLAARDSATLGGMIATNAGGERVVRYGATRANVVGLEAVLANGTVLDRLRGLPKDNTGYDLTNLLVGSEGTLAVITRARLRLVPHLPERVTALVALDSLESAVALVSRLRALDSLERRTRRIRPEPETRRRCAVEYPRRTGCAIPPRFGWPRANPRRVPGSCRRDEPRKHSTPVRRGGDLLIKL
ncbi:hypothetical protein AV521_12955 [Streptomyces sp. IMTB 2501]|nr:FAD-binding oxidoreductase [Streptomyces sp. IMTB 2501]OLZ70908.1 hypothetical protein AV521_12955 [Streptomyces sp. IMTB 2501]